MSPFTVTECNTWGGRGVCTLKFWLCNRRCAQDTAYYWQTESAFQGPHAEYSEYFRNKPGIKLVLEHLLPRQTWPLVRFQTQKTFRVFIQNLECGAVILYPQYWVTLLVTLVSCISCLHILCCVTFPLQRKQLCVGTQVLLSQQALLVSCMNRWWMKAFHLQGSCCQLSLSPSR